MKSRRSCGPDVRAHHHAGRQPEGCRSRASGSRQHPSPTPAPVLHAQWPPLHSIERERQRKVASALVGHSWGTVAQSGGRPRRTPMQEQGRERSMRAGPAATGAWTAAGHAVPIERASAADLALLAMESGGGVPEHLGAVLVLDAGPGFDVESVRRVLAERVRAVPRLRQRLVRMPSRVWPPGVGGRPGFDPARHVRLLPCPDPGDEQALLDLAAAVIIEPLPRSRPLWAAAVVPGCAWRPGRAGAGAAPRPRRRYRRVGDPGPPGRRGRARPGAGRSRSRARPGAELAAAAFRSRLRGLARFRAGWRELPRSLAAGGGVHAPRAVACSILRPVGPRRRFASPAPSWPGCGRRRTATAAPSTTCCSSRSPGHCTRCWRGAASGSGRSGSR